MLADSRPKVRHACRKDTVGRLQLGRTGLPGRMLSWPPSSIPLMTASETMENEEKAMNTKELTQAVSRLLEKEEAREEQSR